MWVWKTRRRDRAHISAPFWPGASEDHLEYVLTAIFYLQASRNLLAWARRAGGLGLIVVGLIDNSAIPTPGSQDVLTILLSAGEKSLWPYYAFMSTLGAVLGGYVTYRLARKEGKALLEKRLSPRRAQQVERAFEKWGFGTVFVTALLPPPLPLFPFLLAAGAFQYSSGKFLAALTLGRGIRYGVLAFLSATYGRLILRWILRYHNPILIAGITAGVGVAVYILLRYRLGKRPGHTHPT